MQVICRTDIIANCVYGIPRQRLKHPQPGARYVLPGAPGYAQEKNVVFPHRNIEKISVYKLIPEYLRLTNYLRFAKLLDSERFL